MLAVTNLRSWKCARDYEPGMAYVVAPGGRPMVVDIGCGRCGLMERLEPHDLQHGEQRIVFEGGQLHQLTPGWLCRHCKASNRVEGGFMVVA